MPKRGLEDYARCAGARCESPDAATTSRDGRWLRQTLASLLADAYGVAAYVRVKAPLASGLETWIYVARGKPPAA